MPQIAIADATLAPSEACCPSTRHLRYHHQSDRRCIRGPQRRRHRRRRLGAGRYHEDVRGKLAARPYPYESALRQAGWVAACEGGELERVVEAGGGTGKEPRQDQRRVEAS